MEKTLDYLQKILKTDIRYLLGQGSWLLSGQALTALSAIVLSWFFANYVEPSDYGLYKFVLAIITIATITSISGVSMPIISAVAKNQGIKLKKIISSQVKFGLIGALGVIIIGLYYIYIGNNLLGLLFLVSSVWIPFYEPVSNYQYFLQGKKNFKLQAKFRVLQRLIFSIIVVAAIALYPNIVFVTFIYFAAYTLTHVIFQKYTETHYPSEDDSDTNYEQIVRFGKKISLQSIFYVGAAQLDKIILFKLLGPTQLAIYIFATSIPNEIQTVLGNINSLAFPKFANSKDVYFKNALLKKIFLMMLIILIPVSLYILAAPYIFNILFPAYTSSIFISQIYVAYVLFTPMNLLWLYFYATGHERALWFGTFIVPSSFILSLILLVPHFGLNGAVMSMYIRAITESLLGLYFFFPIRPPKN